MISQLIEKIKKTNAPICVGLDLMLSYVPEHVVKKSLDIRGETPKGAADAIWRFNKGTIDYTSDLAPAVKPQIAMYEQFGIERLTVYKRTVDYCHEKGLIVIGDAKRGDVGPASVAYAADHLGRVQVGSKPLSGFNVGMLTVNPYLETDGVKSFADACKSEDKGSFVLVKTSNSFSGEFQDRPTGGKSLYEWVAVKVEEWGSDCADGEYSNAGAVVGTTYPEMSGILRKLMPRIHFPAPGYGAQGGIAADLKRRSNQDGPGAVVNSSRGIIAVYKQEKYKNSGPEHFGEAFRQTVIDMAADISSVL